LAPFGAVLQAGVKKVALSPLFTGLCEFICNEKMLLTHLGPVQGTYGCPLRGKYPLTLLADEPPAICRNDPVDDEMKPDPEAWATKSLDPPPLIPPTKLGPARFPPWFR
jgi:hypothetical protein